MIESTKTPSTAFCLLLRLLTMRCTTKQMEQMLNHVDSPYIRCIGFLYLRYASEPKELWDWFMPYLYDTEEVKVVERNMGHHHHRKGHQNNNTVGDFVRGLLDDLDFFGTRLPRLPIGIEKEIKEKLIQEEEIEVRARGHENDKRRMEYFQKVGSRVRALYGDEENEVTWYDAVVDRVVWRDDETGEKYVRPKFVVTFPEYGNTEVVSLGEIIIGSGRGNSMKKDNDMRNNSFNKSSTGTWNRMEHGHRNQDSRNHRDRSYNRNHKESNNYHERHYHDQIGQPPNDDYSRRGRGYQRSYHRNDDRQTSNKDRSRSRDRGHHTGTGSAINHESTHKREKNERENVSSDRAFASYPDLGSKRENDSTKPSVINSNVQQKTREELAAIEEKKRKLMAKYG